MSQLTVDQALQLALEHQKAGQLAEAENIFRQVLAAFPDQADAHHLLAALYLQASRPDIAESTVRHALLLRNEPLFRMTLGLILETTQRFPEAAEVYRALIAEKPQLVEAHLHLGVVLSQLGQFPESAEAFQKALDRAPEGPLRGVAQGNLGIVLCHLKRWDEAIWILREAIVRKPADADFHAALGAAFYYKRQLEPALTGCRKAIALDPRQGQAQNILANVLRDTGKPVESEAAAKQASALLPDVSEAQVNYGESLRSAGHLDAATEHYRKALERLPNSADLHNNLANCLKDTGQVDEAIVEYRKAVSPPAATVPHPSHFSNLLYTLHYHPAYTPQMLFDELQRFDAAMVPPVKHLWKPHPNSRDPNRRLRIGYVSTEFRQHALGLNLVPLLTNHDKSQFEIFCYADVSNPDFFTFRLRQGADQWRDIHAGAGGAGPGNGGTTDSSPMSMEQLADLIRRDQIDILLDLHQHIGGNKLPLYALKPAPVQIAFAGYPGSSGLSTMDYRLTDPFLEPPDQPQFPSTEKAIRLPATFWCYHPAAEVPVNELPAAHGKPFTFGNLNNFCKLNDGVYALWARIMQAVPHSQLLLLAPPGSHRERTKSKFESHGIAPDRVRFVGRQNAGDYYRLYHQIDLTLDSFPCNGHTTSMDSFFMGVPVTTIIGDRLFGRATWSQLNNLALTELAGANEQEFIELSIALARDLPRLAELRRTLRPRMQQSPLMQEIPFARGIESAYRQAWQYYCTTQ